MRNSSRRVIAVPLIAVALTVAASTASDAWVPGTPSKSICTSAPALISIAKSVVDRQSSADALSLRARSFHITGSGSVVENDSGERRAMIIRTPQKANRLCESVRPGAQNINLTPDGDIDGASLLALHLVVEYRAAHPYPGPGLPAPTDDAATTVYLNTFGKYIVVGLIGDKSKFRGCQAQETYRVDPASGQVLPFDNCLEGHKIVLPGIRQLPE